MSTSLEPKTVRFEMVPAPTLAPVQHGMEAPVVVRPHVAAPKVEERVTVAAPPPSPGVAAPVAQGTGAAGVGVLLSGATIGDAVLCTDARENWSGDYSGRTVCADLRGVDLHGLDFRSARYCARDERDGVRSCRPVRRQELIDHGHADLAGALAPA